MAGFFISFEGIDGSGKTTQARRLAEALRKRGFPVTLTREPGGSEGGEEIRRLLVEGAPGRWSPVTELLLFNAARRDHLERLISPRLEAGEIVISDRFADSTRVYQGAVDPALRDMAEEIHRRAIGREPDLTFFIDTDADLAARRGRPGREDRFEAKGDAFQKRLAEAFRALAAAEPERIVRIDGNRPAEEIADEILRITLARLPTDPRREGGADG